MSKAIFTEPAESDLREIVEYIAQNNLDAALSWLQETRAACDLLAKQPDIGERIQTKRFGEVRRHVVGNYLIYYRHCGIGIYVVRILHGARDQRPLI